MSEGWQTKRLEQVIEKSGTVDPRKEPDEFFQYVDVSSVSNKTFRIEETSEILGIDAPSRARRLIRSGDVLFATIRPTLRRIAVVPSELDQQVCSTGYFVFRTKPVLDNRFLYYFLFTDRFMDAMESLQSGASYPAVNDTQVKKQEISFPPLEEQKRIVAILDEAFEGIEKAQANTEQNLANARELFESYLKKLLIQNNDDLTEKKIGEVCDLYQGLAINKKTRHLLVEKSNLPLLRIKDLRNSTEEQYVADSGFPKNAEVFDDDIIYTRTGQIGLVFRGRRGVLHNNSFKIVPKLGLDKAYLFWWLQEPSFKQNIIALASRAAQPDITHKLFKEQVIRLPSLQDQLKIADKIEAMFNYTIKLNEHYESKKSNLDSLMMSLLQKAFSGELTSSNVVAFTRSVSQQQTVTTTTPKFGAHVIAYGYHWHEGQRKNRTYGHVKTQKFLHLAESVADVDMGRSPEKCAAGPHDAQHMRQAEDWARVNQFFEFVQRSDGKGYTFKKLANYNQLIGDSINAVKPYQDKIQKILSLLLPMNTREAEVLATVHAAWNNLLLDNTAITDDAIIHEARENWTESKRSIPKNEFRKAIITIRNNGIVPDGTAKRVTGQENLPL